MRETIVDMTQKKNLDTADAQPAAPASPSDETASRSTRGAALLSLLPGVAFCLVGALLAWFAAQILPGVSALLIAIVLGAVWRNLAPVPEVLDTGIAFTAKRLLRVGIVLLGFQLSISAVADLGAGVLLVVVAAVAVTFFVTLWLGHLLGVSLAQRLLIASGFSICGAAAVAATEGPAKAKQEEVATAIALVVLFGTLMIPLVPFLGNLFGMHEEMLGMWIGSSTHEVAQVVAAGGAVGSSALAVAVTVKLARVVTLAPIIAGISVAMRRRGVEDSGTKPPIVPLFVIGFLAAVLVRTTGVLPEPVLTSLEGAQSITLAAAMVALGLGVHLPSLFRVGMKPVILGVLSTATILSVSLGAVVLLSHT